LLFERERIGPGTGRDAEGPIARRFDVGGIPMRYEISWRLPCSTVFSHEWLDVPGTGETPAP
jgi:hypothetical protein